MAEVVDVRGLTEEQVKFIREFVKFLKAKFTQEVEILAEKRDETQEIRLGSWALDVKGKLTREETYDYL